MAPLIALVTVTLLLRVRLTWGAAVRGGVAVMFLMTGTAHFVGMRANLIQMVPPALPNPALLVSVTGVLELLGAIGLLVPRLAPWAAAGLTLMLVGMFPANLYAATHGIMTAW